MTNAQKNEAFLERLDEKTKALILQNIANHYDISEAKVLKEVTPPEAEHLLDYVTSPERAAMQLFMCQTGLSV